MNTPTVSTLTADGLIARYKAGERDFRGANLYDANLHGANLCDADLSGANLRDANLCDADLRGANLHGTNLHGTNLRDADLRGANLRDANLHGTDLSGANLRGTNLHGTNLRDANLHGANGIIALYVPSASSRGDYLYAVQHEDAVMVKAGCFWGTLDAFERRVRDEKGDGALYLHMVALIRAVWPAAEKPADEPTDGKH